MPRKTGHKPSIGALRATNDAPPLLPSPGQSPFFLTTFEEYSFLHDCLLERVTSGLTSVSRDLVGRYMEELQGGRRNSYPYPEAERQYMVSGDGAGAVAVTSIGKYVGCTSLVYRDGETLSETEDRRISKCI